MCNVLVDDDFGISRLVSVVLSFGSRPLASDMVNLGMFFGIEFALADSTFMDCFLHDFPLFFGDFELIDMHDVVMVAVDHPGMHGYSAVCLEWPVETAYLSCLGVERAGATTLHAALTNC